MQGKRKRPDAKEDSICVECGQVIPDGGRRRICDACMKAHRKRQTKERNARIREEWLATPQQCERCGGEFFATGKCHFCPECRGPSRGVTRRKSSKRVNWVVNRAKRGQDNTPDPAIVGEGPAGRMMPRDPLEGAVLRDDGVLVLAPCTVKKLERKPPKQPPKGTRPGSMADVQYRLDKENYERWLRGERPVSYGYFVAYLEGRMPLKK